MTTFNENSDASEFIGLFMKMFNETKYNLQALNKRFDYFEKCLNNIMLLNTEEPFDEEPQEEEELYISPEDMNFIAKTYIEEEEEKQKHEQEKKPKKSTVTPSKKQNKKKKKKDESDIENELNEEEDFFSRQEAKKINNKNNSTNNSNFITNYIITNTNANSNINNNINTITKVNDNNTVKNSRSKKQNINNNTKSNNILDNDDDDILTKVNPEKKVVKYSEFLKLKQKEKENNLKKESANKYTNINLNNLDLDDINKYIDSLEKNSGLVGNKRNRK